jgi:hypothetical protein
MAVSKGKTTDLGCIFLTGNFAGCKYLMESWFRRL